MGGADKDNVVKNFLLTLADNNRLSALEGVCENFATLMGAHRGEVELRVTSAAVWFPRLNPWKKKKRLYTSKLTFI
jgi:F0F1-type ATP synthase delta subunit